MCINAGIHGSRSKYKRPLLNLGKNKLSLGFREVALKVGGCAQEWGGSVE